MLCLPHWWQGYLWSCSQTAPSHHTQSLKDPVPICGLQNTLFLASCIGSCFCFFSTASTLLAHTPSLLKQARFMPLHVKSFSMHLLPAPDPSSPSSHAHLAIDNGLPHIITFFELDDNGLPRITFSSSYRRWGLFGRALRSYGDMWHPQQQYYWLSYSVPSLAQVW